MAVVFIIDSVFYFFALLDDSDCSRSRGVSAQAQPHTWFTVKSRIDIYLAATLLFFVGSVFYLFSALYAIYGSEGDSELLR